MKQNQNVVVLADFPPVIGGPPIWYQRVCELLRERGYAVFSLGGRGTPPPGVIDLNPVSGKTGTVFKIFLFCRDALAEAWTQRNLLWLLLTQRMILRADWAKTVSYLVLIRRVYRRLPPEPGTVLAAHAHMNSLLGLMLCRRLSGWRLVIRCHGGGILEFSRKNPALVRYLMRQADGLACVSDFIAGHCRRHGAQPEKVRVILSARDIPEEAFTGEKTDTVLFCGRLVADKDPETFLAAVRRIREINPALFARVRFVLIGGGPEEIRLREYIGRNGLDERVFLSGVLPHERVWDMMKTAKVLVLPSRREPSGGVLTEAMAFRCYCIAAATGGIPELVTPERGTVFAVGDAGACADAIIDFFEHQTLYRQKIETAYEYVREHYSFSRAVDQLDRMFRPEA